MENKRAIDISTGIVFRTALIILGLWFLYFIRDIIALLFISIILVAAMDPVIYRLHRRKIPRSVGVFIVYFCLFASIGLVGSFLIPSLISQVSEFTQKLPEIVLSLDNSFRGINNFFQAQHIAVSTQSLLVDMGKWLAGSSGNIFSATAGIFSGFVAATIVLVMTFYMVVKEEGIKNFIVYIMPRRHKDYAGSLVLRIQRKISRWVLGQASLMFIVFTLDFIGLFILGIPYALILAIFAGILEIVPYIGPIISVIPAVIVGLTVSPFSGLLVLILFILVQQFENHIIIPQVMRKAVGLHPIAVILTLLIGLKLGGVLGALLAIPVATAISVFVSDFFGKSKEV